MENQKANKSAQPEVALKDLKVKDFKIENPAQVIEEAVGVLDEFGGFDLYTIFDDNFENLDPDAAAAKDVYLSENEWKEDRRKLLETTKLLIGVLSQDGTITELIENCEAEARKNEALFNKNLLKALEITKDLEQAYWNVAVFFKNTNSDDLEYFQIMNVSREGIADLNDRKFFPAIEQSFKEGYHKFDLSGNYSNLIIPGWLGSKQAIDKWGDMVHKYKAMLVTDYRDFDLKSAKKFLDKDSLASGSPHAQHIVLAYNQLVARKRDEHSGEIKDMHVSAAAALGGLMYDTEVTPISQPRAGTKHGRVKEISACVEELLDFETASLDEKSIVPMIFSKNSVFAWGNRTLYNGSNIGLQDYAIVKTFDWIGKVLMNFVTNECFLNFTSTLKKELKENIQRFLNDYMGPNNLIQQYDLKGINQDPVSKDIIIDLEITPFFAAKNFHIKLTGHEGKEFDADVK